VSVSKVCPTCGTEYPADERFCPRDGTALRAQGGNGDLIGSIIADRYHVQKKLGSGGMGQVFLAEHVKMGRRSAVKVMNPGMVHDADAISRFNREAANASRINHPNVAAIYDFGETSDGLIYLAMEYVEGEVLTELVEANGALPPLRAADVTRQAAGALAVAHDMGIVHRDLKPDNIMIARNRDGSDCVKVVDFGIAKAAGNEAQKVTRTGLVVGTPEYMSPEQLAGDELDGRSDVYSLALVAFHMLTGGLPFPSDTAQESMIMRLTERPKPLAELNPGTSWPAEVQAVMDRALEREAAKRYQSATEFGRALYAAVERMPGAELATAGTQVMSATGATQALPPTRAAAVSAPVSAPVAAPATKGRAGMLVGGGVLALAAVVSAVMLTRGEPATQTAAPTPAPVAVGALAAGSTREASSASRRPTASPNAPQAKRDEGAATTVSTGVSYGDELERLARSVNDPTSAESAMQRVESYRGKITLGSDRSTLQVVEAKALMFMPGKVERGCRMLKAVRTADLGAELRREVNDALTECGN
jgi:hypothetical protein